MLRAREPATGAGLQFNPLVAQCGKERFCQFQRQQHIIPLHTVLTCRAKTQDSLQCPCFSANVFVRGLVLQIMDLQRALFFSGTLKGEKSLNGKKDQVAALHVGCLLPTYRATVLEAKLHNYTVPIHNYLQLV